MAQFDCIVVGAGPAGSTAARELASAGARVLIVDRAEFPRYKACGGGIPLRTEKLLPFPIDSVVEDSVGLLRVAHNGSGDFSALAGTCGFVELPPGPNTYPKGFVTKLYRW